MTILGLILTKPEVIKSHVEAFGMNIAGTDGKDLYVFRDRIRGVLGLPRRVSSPDGSLNKSRNYSTRQRSLSLMQSPTNEDCNSPQLSL